MDTAGNNQDAQRVGFSSVPVEQGEAAPAEPGWLTQFEKLSPAENLARLDTDRQLVEELRAQNFSGLHWNYYATELAKYGLAVLTGWTMRGLIFDRVKKYSFGGLPQPIDDALRDHQTAESLAGEVVAISLRAFRERVLIPGKWDPSKGASIKTFFIGQCLMQFPNIYRKWHTETYDQASMRAESINDDENFDEDLLANGEDVAVTVTIQSEIDRALEAVKDPRAKKAYVLAAAGHTHEEIGQHLEMTPKAVERMLHYERSKRRQKGELA
ncbi:sigma-70 family RNA polymerase sigma factor [Mycetocola manganoxydans]|uniref:Sigma-70 family RNA polymerase sigma factor n=1 Tax=Mycetocola manganoxydans TaxID=699879 RepID=A0A3L6ZNA2_9MICO|nr:sigma-70 family RNA polymerase sigma factor [Mycetocola manganoxydans]RLP69370.1 sigma-70 family RNA polymerase sigma factor [Mycetocola manganoxydans]GHD50854.1 putative transcriptional rgulator [Mycetocola manganoxydans]